MRTKYILLQITTAVVLLTSCGAPEQKEELTGNLKELKTKRDSLKAVYTKINKDLKAIDKKINALDSSSKLYIVSTVSAEQSNFKHYIEVHGNVNSDQSISLYPEIGGLIKRIYVKEGQKVKKGALLVKFNSDVLQKSISEINTSIELAKTTYEKQKGLWEKKIGSEIDYLTAKTNYESLLGKKAAINAQIAQTEIRATFSGIIDQVFIKQGEMAAPNMPALRLINLNNVYIEAEVSEKYLRKIKKGTEVQITFPNLNKKMESKVTMTGNFINSANRTFRIVVNIDNKKHLIKPNQLAVLNVLDIEKDGVTVPSNLILNSPSGESYIYSAEKDGANYKVVKSIIKTGASYKGNTLVLSGIKTGTLIIDKGSRSVQNGQKIKIKN